MPILGSIEEHDVIVTKARLKGREVSPTPEDVLLRYLHGAYQDGRPLQINAAATSKTGRQLADRVVSRLEVAWAFAQLPREERAVMECLFDHGMSRKQTCLRLSMDDRTMHDHRNRALRIVCLNVMDWSGPKELAA